MQPVQPQSLRLALSIALAAGTFSLVGCGQEDDGIPEVVNAGLTAANPDRFLTYLAPSEDPTTIEAYNQSTAYYNTIDPNKERTNLGDWKTANDFGEDCATGDRGPSGDPLSCEVVVKFRDAKDLGYGRHLHLRWEKSKNRVAAYVDNYQVVTDTFKSYGPLNLEAVQAEEAQYHFGTNALEFSADETDPSTDPYLKFYTFEGSDTGKAEDQRDRRLSLDFDGTGPKAVPHACMVCHGGYDRIHLQIDDPEAETLELKEPVAAHAAGDLDTSMKVLEVDALECTGYASCANDVGQAGKLRFVNQAILWSFEQQSSSKKAGMWDPSLSIDLVEKAYSNLLDTNEITDVTQVSPLFNSSLSVPSGWEGDPQTYLDAVGPYCVTCHSKRGAGGNHVIDLASVNDFNAYQPESADVHGEKAMTFYTSHTGLMPLSLLTYRGFWQDAIASGSNAGKTPAQVLFGDDVEVPQTPYGLSDAAITELDQLVESTGELSFDDIKGNLDSPTCLTCHSTNNNFAGGAPVSWDEGDYDSAAEFEAAVKLRVNYEYPDLSPLLRKLSGFNHAGGALLPPSSDGHTQLRSWIWQEAKKLEQP